MIKCFPGDIIQIRSWQSMKDEFGGNEQVIDSSVSFVRNMRELCGCEVEAPIGSIKIRDLIVLFEDKYPRLNWDWGFSEDMFEIIVPQTKPISKEDFLSIFD